MPFMDKYRAIPFKQLLPCGRVRLLKTRTAAMMHKYISAYKQSIPLHASPVAIIIVLIMSWRIGLVKQANGRHDLSPKQHAQSYDAADFLPPGWVGDIVGCRQLLELFHAPKVQVNLLNPACIIGYRSGDSDICFTVESEPKIFEPPRGHRDIVVEQQQLITAGRTQPGITGCWEPRFSGNRTNRTRSRAQ